VSQEALDRVAPVRRSLPNKYGDPQVGHGCTRSALTNTHLCDEAGLNIVSDGDYAGINCLYGASSVILGILTARPRTSETVARHAGEAAARPRPHRRSGFT
jgi:hypothetical protein